MIEELAESATKKPAWILAAVVGVVILALYARNQQPQVINADFAGGGAARGIDPNAAAIEEAAINAGQQNVQTVAQLIGLENSNSTALTGSLAQTEAGRTTALAQTDAELQSALARIEADRQVAEGQTAASVEISAGNNAASTTAAQINADMAQAIAAANAATEAARIRSQEAISASQDATTRAVAHTQSNTTLWGDVIHGATDILAVFGL